MDRTCRMYVQFLLVLGKEAIHGRGVRAQQLVDGLGRSLWRPPMQRRRVRKMVMCCLPRVVGNTLGSAEFMRPNNAQQD